MLLLDLGHLLDVQQDASFGTLVSGNPLVCFNPSQVWGHRDDSYLEFYEAEVGA